jgi:Copper type II ascorbate-dependent monooxygenase, N-terminal domain/Copper type II ascorbate-dependent monooxygenase, C-terminal domain
VRAVWSALFIVVAALAALACSTGDPAAPRSNAAAPPTYHRDVAPILTRSCIKCHYEGGIGPFALTSYEMARDMAPALVVEVGARRMPPWTAHDTSECAPPLPWRADERLSNEEIEILQRWYDAGSPEGNPADAPVDVDPIQSLDLALPTVELEPMARFQPARSDSDEFRCFVLDSPVAEQGGFISAINVIPGNRQVVHHATVYSDADGIASRRAGPDGSFDCSGAAAVDMPINGDAPRLGWLLAWAPGMRPLELPSNMGLELPRGAKIVMEVHYSTGGKQVEPDLSRLQLVMAPATPELVIGTWTTGNFGAPLPNGDGLLPGPNDDNGVEFRVPAQSTDHYETMLATIPPLDEPMPIFGLRAHAHLSTIDVKIDVLRDGSEQCLLQDRWDFHWQRVYTYDASTAQLPTLYGGEKIRVRCSYDNSMMNRRLAQELWARGLPPMDMHLGGATLEEMCMVDLLYVKKLP